MSQEQKIRAVLFYTCVLIFLIGLPFILSFALGYKFDRRTFKFTKTGLVVLKTQPAGASVYLNNALLNEKTPLTINELLPGDYNIRIELERHYPWLSEVKVSAGNVSRLEKIILFPLRPNIKQLNKERLYLYLIDQEDKTIYYANQDDNNVYTSNLEGERYERVAALPQISPPAIKFKLSEDKEKLLCFNKHQIAITYLKPSKEKLSNDTSFILNYPDDTIIEAFWHSDNYHLIIVGDKKIRVMEANPQAMPVDLVNLNKRNTSSSYDINSDTLYFVDYQKAADGNFYNNLYKLELNTRNFIFQELIKLKSVNE